MYMVWKVRSSLTRVDRKVKGSFFKIENLKYVWRHRGKTVYKGRT